MKPVLKTLRLVLREMEADDLDFVAEMLAHPEVSRYYERMFSRADAAEWLERQRRRYERDGHGLWLAVERETERPVGQVGLARQDVEGTPRPEVGWLLHRPYWGRGYATEAGCACRDAAFARWGYSEVVSLIRPINEASRRVAERIGMSPERHVAFHGFDHILYRVAMSGPARSEGSERSRFRPRG
jgi:RimJ/RimL family protein N-acetyltransferase